MKKAIIINNYFYNQEDLDYLKEYIDNTLERLGDIYYRLGGLESDILKENEMIALYNFIDLLSKYELIEVKR